MLCCCSSSKITSSVCFAIFIAAVLFLSACLKLACCMRTSPSSSSSQSRHLPPTFVVSLTNSPIPLLSTNVTLPSSCPGRKSKSSTGRPQQQASAIVPGPALVTRTSAAIIHSSMFDTNPRMRMSHSVSPCFTFSASHVSCFCSFSFFPQMITICSFCILPLDLRAKKDMAHSLSLPIPSPPPIRMTTRQSCLSSSLSRISSLFFLLESMFQKPLRSGSPQTETCSSFSPNSNACAFISSIGTNILSSPLLNHQGCASPRSVTTVTKGIRLPSFMWLDVALGADCKMG
mmetsp:Transcript_10185/g.34001  ORF Transcript_10185/g.34001 Transcript_10185/m.34001 type:complete len:288 (-) Transcript_10185:928-1791(-)